MSMFGLPLANLFAGLIAVALFSAGLVNLFGSQTLRESFVRWGYPSWWNYATGGLEILAGSMIATAAFRTEGLALGAAICVAAVATLAKHREFADLAPSVALIALLAADFALTWS